MRAYWFFSISKPWQRGMKAASATLKPVHKICFASLGTPPATQPCHLTMTPPGIASQKMSHISGKDVLYL